MKTKDEKSDAGPDIKDLDAYLNEFGGKAFETYVGTEKHGDMEADLWARRNFMAGFKAGAIFGKGK